MSQMHTSQIPDRIETLPSFVVFKSHPLPDFSTILSRYKPGRWRCPPQLVVVVSRAVRLGLGFRV